ncbi:hypothetical protein DL768_004646 [Monosporascus sp. mg162]|nr:hypothetical protein DL768_004646 [Monosporascus sp. mg162]
MASIPQRQDTSLTGWTWLNGFLTGAASCLCIPLSRKKSKLYDPLPSNTITDGIPQGSTYNNSVNLDRDTVKVRITVRANPDAKNGETEATPLLVAVLDSAAPEPTETSKLAGAAGRQTSVSAIRNSQGIIHLQLPKDNGPKKKLRLILRIVAPETRQEGEGTADVDVDQRIEYPDDIAGPHDMVGDRCDSGHEIESRIVEEIEENEDAEDSVEVEPPENQSMHAPTCDPNKNSCHRIKWNKESYLNCKDPPAVKITDHEVLPAQLQYVPASRRTMAISHVWSHGQGGRPHLGINSCLYQWYRAIAKKQWDAQRGVARCDSFWIDAACIPDEYGLRREAIANINNVFRNAAVVLVIDRGIMECVASNSEEDMVLVHDAWQNSEWNKRAWTLLEGIRGTEQLHLLCAKDRVISVKDMARRMRRLEKVKLMGREKSELLGLFEKAPAGYSFPFESGGTLLAKRTASRPGDIAVIWSLLCPKACRKEICYDMAELLSRVAQGPGIRTCFLMATMPRLKMPGFRWGPTGAKTSRFNYRFSEKQSDHSALAKCRGDPLGLTAGWLVWELQSQSDWPEYLTLLALDYVEPLDLSSCLRSGQRVALLQAATGRGRLCHNSLSYITSHRLVAVCFLVRDQGKDQYEWKGLFYIHKVTSGVGSDWYISDPGDLSAHFTWKEVTLV